ncbi:MAG: ATP-binding protein, partial [Spirochaetota bacterium]
GSGKSTLVDAVTTLLVPSHRISYNKAAGAENKERSLKSYVQGYYKSERTEGGYGAKPVALRDQNSYSVILGVFKNKGYGQVVTLAQVFWQKELQGQPNRFFVVADGELSIQNDFSDFGNDIKNLRKRLKAVPFIDDCYESFPPYSASFRRRFGIDDEQALELFHQTVSMKSVGNLTDFVRSHMLEAFDAEQRISALIAHFDDLTRAHNSVMKAKEQIERLRPLVEDIGIHGEITAACDELRGYRDGLRYYFAVLKEGLLLRRERSLDDEQKRITAKISQLQEKHSLQQGQRDKIRQSIAENGGDRLERLKSDIAVLLEKKNERMRKFDEYGSLAKQLSLSPAGSIDSFMNNRTAIEESLVRFDGEEQELQNSLTETAVALKSARDSHSLITEDLKSLKGRRSNIDSKQIGIRSQLCQALGVKAEDLPFAGELLQVKQDAAAWEGVIERLLRNFALSILVPDHLYADLSSWVDRTDLKGRIVYYKIGSNPKQESLDLRTDSLVHKISVKPDSVFCHWLEQELSRRFDYCCCSDLAGFRRETHAVTAAGQIKGSGNRHEKDDRHDINDRSRYVLGWSNEAKIAVLELKRADAEKRIQTLSAEISGIQSGLKRSGERKTAFVRLDTFSSFEELDWKSAALQLDSLESERIRLENSSDILKTLNSELTNLESAIKLCEAALDKEKDEQSRNSEKLNQTKLLLTQCGEILSLHGKKETSSWVEKMDMLRTESLGEHHLSVESADNRQQEMREWLQKKIDNESRRMKTFEERIIRTMQDYRREYVSETKDIDA